MSGDVGVTVVVVTAVFLVHWLLEVRADPAALKERLKDAAVVFLVVLAVAFVLLPMWNAIYKGMCPAGQHPVGGQMGTDIECEYDR